MEPPSSYIPGVEKTKFLDVVVGLCAGRGYILRLERKQLLKYFQSLPPTLLVSSPDVLALRNEWAGAVDECGNPKFGIQSRRAQSLRTTSFSTTLSSDATIVSSHDRDSSLSSRLSKTCMSSGSSINSVESVLAMKGSCHPSRNRPKYPGQDIPGVSPSRGTYPARDEYLAFADRRTAIGRFPGPLPLHGVSGSSTTAHLRPSKPIVLDLGGKEYLKWSKNRGIDELRKEKEEAEAKVIARQEYESGYKGQLRKAAEELILQETKIVPGDPIYKNQYIISETIGVLGWTAKGEADRQVKRDNPATSSSQYEAEIGMKSLTKEQLASCPRPNMNYTNTILNATEIRRKEAKVNEDIRNSRLYRLPQIPLHLRRGRLVHIGPAPESRPPIPTVAELPLAQQGRTRKTTRQRAVPKKGTTAVRRKSAMPQEVQLDVN